MPGHAQHYVLHVACRGCGARFFAVIDGVLPACLVCGAQRWRIVGIWNLRTQVWPSTLAQTQHLNHEPPTAWNTLSSNEL